MPGFKPKADLAFRDMRIAIIRLTNASETQQQHDVIKNLLQGLAQIEPLWNVTPIEPKPKSEKAYHDAQVKAMNDQPIPKPSREQYLRWHEADPVKFPLPPDDNLT